MAEFDGISEYLKAAIQRLEDALELLQPPTLYPNRSDAKTRHLRGAMYLAGYALECIIKAYIITRFKAQTLEEAIRIAPASKRRLMKKLNTVDGHNLRLLISLTDMGIPLAGNVSMLRHWTICLTWDSGWRYNPRPVRVEHAREFVDAAAQVHAWISRQIQEKSHEKIPCLRRAML